MKNLLLLSLLVASFSYGQDLWIQKDSMNGPPRANCATFVSGDDGYVVTGYDGFGKKKSMVSYDISQDDWDDELSLGGSSGDGLNRSSSVGFSINGMGFICTGEGTGFMFSDLWMFDRFTNTWTQMANFPGGARTQAVSFEMDEMGFVGLGKADDFTTLLNDFYKYDFNTNTWTQVADFPGTPRMDAIATKMGGKAYVGLGRDASSFPNDFYEYFPADDTWSQKSDFPGTPRANAVSFARFPQLFVTTGDDGFNYLGDTWEYNYFGDVWTQRTDFPGGPRAGAISLSILDRFYVGSGFANGNYYDDFYEYTFVFSIGDEQTIDFSLYPNPAQSFVNLSFSMALNNPTFQLFDVSGKEVQFNDLVSSASASEFVLNLATVESGTYFILVSENGNKIGMKQIQIVHG